MSLRSIWAVVRFEWNRFRAIPQLAWWAGLALFPAAITMLVYTQSPGTMTELDKRETVFLFFALSAIVNLLGLLLSATPVIHSELEGKTWPYLAVRPRAKASVLVGKYLAAVIWSGSAAWAALTLCFLILRPENALAYWSALSGLLVLASLAYGALFVFTGVLFLNRAMTLAVGYVLGIEGLIAWVPAFINQLTLSLRIRSMMPSDLIPPELAQQAGFFDRETPVALHAVVVVGYAAALLTVAVVVLQRRQLVTRDEQ